MDSPAQAVQYIRSNKHSRPVHKVIYMSGWTVAANRNQIGMLPDLGLYNWQDLVDYARVLRETFRQNSIIDKLDGVSPLDWNVPIVVDVEAYFGGGAHALVLIKALIEGAMISVVHAEDQDPQARRCGHMGSKIVVPAREIIKKHRAARLMADILGVPLVIIGRTDTIDAVYLNGVPDPSDEPYITGNMSDGMLELDPRKKIERGIQRMIDLAPVCDVLWPETKNPDLAEAKVLAEGLHSVFPDKDLAYNCSPSFPQWATMSENELRAFQDKLYEYGYKYMFITLAGIHQVAYYSHMFANDYLENGMAAYGRLQRAEFAAQAQDHYSFVKHQKAVGLGVFDKLQSIALGGEFGTEALKSSTESGF